MGKVYKLGIATDYNKKIQDRESIEVITDKGVVGDRHFKDYNDPYCQLSLIESENIDQYNTKYGLNISYVDFRRNVVTKGIKLNNRVGKSLQKGTAQIEVIDLCRPCKHLSQILDQDNILKEFLRRGGLRCKILKSSIITVGDEIKVLK